MRAASRIQMGLCSLSCCPPALMGPPPPMRGSDRGGVLDMSSPSPLRRLHHVLVLQTTLVIPVALGLGTGYSGTGTAQLCIMGCLIV